MARIYKAAPQDFMKSLAFGSILGCLNETYMALVKEKELDPIEALPAERKAELWNRSAKIAEKRSERILVSRSIYLLEVLAE